MRARALLLGLVLATLMALAGCRAKGAVGTLPTVVLGVEATRVEAVGADGPGAVAPQPLVSRAMSGLTASGRVAPARQAQLAFGSAGRVAQAAVAEGERVAAGQTLLTLDDQIWQAQRAQAQAALEGALASQALQLAGPSDEALRQAQAAVDIAVAGLGALEAGPRPEQVAQAEASLATAQAGLTRLERGATALELEGARLGVEQARGALWAAQSQRDVICGSRALAESQCDGAEAQVLVAETGVKQAENQLARLAQGADAETLTQARQAVRAAAAQLTLAQQPATRYDLAAAQAQVAAAQAGVAALEEGPRPAQLAAAQAQVAAAQAQVDAVEAQRELLAVSAPFAGVVTALNVHAGQWVTPGQVAVVVADLDALVVETTDLSELDVPGIAAGQPVVVTIEALALDAPGRVSAIAPLAETLGGDVVYRVTVTLDEQPAGLRAGMSVRVAF
jgi:HlyD family secretion protein